MTTLPPPLIRLDGAYELSVKAVAADTLISQRILRAVHVTIAYQWPLADDDSPLTCSSELIRHSRRNTESNETLTFSSRWMWVDVGRWMDESVHHKHNFIFFIPFSTRLLLLYLESKSSVVCYLEKLLKGKSRA